MCTIVLNNQVKFSTHMSCVENLVGIYSNHMVFRQNLSPLFREPSLFFRGDEFPLSRAFAAAGAI